MHRFDPTILRAYDIRGTVGRNLSAQDAYWLGRTVATELATLVPQPRVCLGWDGRWSSPDLTQALAAGLRESGAVAMLTGLGPTPMLYFATQHLQADAGIMVTGSHNPPQENGFKLMRGHRENYAPWFGDGILRLGQRAAAGAVREAPGGIEDHPVRDAYLARLLQEPTAGFETLRVAWDAGNGAAGEMMAALCASLPGEHLPLFAEIDGRFPHHHPDPSVAENLESLIAAVGKHRCDLGLAFDGDGDRLGVVDETGDILWGDEILMLLSEPVLKAQPGATVIADVKASQRLFDHVARQGGNPLIWKTGHSHIKTKMKETNAPLAGEMSGHLFFADRYGGYDDGLYAALRVLQAVAALGIPLSKWRASLPQSHSTPELRFPCDESMKFGIVDSVAAALAEENAEVNTVDGVRVRTADGWWLLRASNTQAVLVARAEAEASEGLTRLLTHLEGHLKPYGLTLPPEARTTA